MEKGDKRKKSKYPRFALLFCYMGISLELLTIKKILFFSSHLLLLYKCGAKHINEIGWEILNLNLENQFCNPYWCARHGTAWG